MSGYVFVNNGVDNDKLLSGKLVSSPSLTFEESKCIDTDRLTIAGLEEWINVYVNNGLLHTKGQIHFLDIERYYVTNNLTLEEMRDFNMREAHNLYDYTFEITGAEYNGNDLYLHYQKNEHIDGTITNNTERFTVEMLLNIIKHKQPKSPTTRAGQTQWSAPTADKPY